MLAGLDGSGMKGLTFIDNGFRDLSNSERPIESLEDFEGLSFRVIGAPVFINTFSALGTNPVPMPFPEVYTALETGTVVTGIGLGLVEALTKVYYPEASSMVMFLVMVLVLLVRPNGLFGGVE